MKNIFSSLLVAVSLLFFPHSIFAQGGLTPTGAPAATMKTLDQIEPRTPIDTNTTPGDANSLFKITQPGSYYLATNLTGVAAKHGIEIAASGVTLDLMGFELDGGVTNSLDGVNVSVIATNIAIRNGTVRNWGGNGVNVVNAANGQYQDLRLSANGGRGLDGGFGCRVSGCTARGNVGDGIGVIDGSTVSGCAAQKNGGNGIHVTGGSTVSSCVAHNNNGDGIFASTGSTVSGCTADANNGDGIEVDLDCRVVENNCSLNGNGGDGAGIHVINRSNRIDSNNVTDNDRGIDVDIAGNLIIRNSASGNTTNWDVVVGNVILVVNATTASAVIGNSGGVAPGSTDPNANFSY